jgi:tetratricopeptide (TPR) repeat protein
MDEALQHVEKAIEIQPNLADAHLIKGILIYKNGHKEKALEEMDLAIKHKGKNPEAHNSKGDMLFAAGKYEEALESYTKATHDEPNFAQAWAGMGNIHAQKRDFEKAKEAYRRAKEINPSDKNILYGLAVMLEKMGQPQEAIQEYQAGALLETDPMMQAKIRMHIQQLMQTGFNITPLNLGDTGNTHTNDNNGGLIYGNNLHGTLSKPFADELKIKSVNKKSVQQ